MKWPTLLSKDRREIISRYGERAAEQRRSTTGTKHAKTLKDILMSHAEHLWACPQCNEIALWGPAIELGRMQ